MTPEGAALRGFCLALSGPPGSCPAARRVAARSTLRADTRCFAATAGREPGGPTCAESSTAAWHGGSLQLWAPNHMGGGPGDAGCPAGLASPSKSELSIEKEKRFPASPAGVGQQLPDAAFFIRRSGSPLTCGLSGVRPFSPGSAVSVTSRSASSPQSWEFHWAVRGRLSRSPASTPRR